MVDLKKLPADFHTVIEDLEAQAEICDDNASLLIARKTETLLRKFAREAGYDLSNSPRVWVFK